MDPVLLTSLGPRLAESGSEISMPVAINLELMMKLLVRSQGMLFDRVCGVLGVHPRTVRRLCATATEVLGLPIRLERGRLHLESTPAPFRPVVLTRQELTDLRTAVLAYREWKGPLYAEFVKELLAVLDALERAAGQGSGPKDGSATDGGPGGKVARLLSLQLCLERGVSPTRGTLSRDVAHRTIRTVDRDLDTARNTLGWDVKARPCGGYYLATPLPTAPGSVSAYHRLLLDGLLVDLSRCGHLPFRSDTLPSLRSRVVRLARVDRPWAPLGPVSRMRWTSVPAPAPMAMSSHLETLSFALLSGQWIRLTFSHLGVTNSVPVRPTELVRNAGGWTLSGWRVWTRRDDTWSLGSIREVELLPDDADEHAFAE